MFNTNKPIFTRELKIGIVGGGHLTRALLAGWVRSKAPLVVTVIDRNADKRRRLREQFGAACFANLANLPSRLDMLLIAIKPGGCAGALRRIFTAGGDGGFLGVRNFP